MAQLVIVAIPQEDDYVWKISSEKVPHLTLLFLGETGSVRNINKISEFLEHAVNTMLHKFDLTVDHRGTLGVDQADVLFFDDKDKWGFDAVKDFRDALLQNDNVKAAYESVPQFDGFTPHLTLGYPETPAHKDDRDYPGIHYVAFDKIALWYGDYTGPEFQLTRERWDDLAMADLSHHGVKGMRWGVRRKNVGKPGEVVVTTNTNRMGKAKIKTTGGKDNPPSEDAIKVATVKQKAKKSGTASLSNDEIQTVVTRMNLESQLSQKSQSNAAAKFVSNTLKNTGKQQVQNAANQAASLAIKKGLAAAF
jgi:2'-5' RNA ligase